MLAKVISCAVIGTRTRIEVDRVPELTCNVTVAENICSDRIAAIIFNTTPSPGPLKIAVRIEFAQIDIILPQRCVLLYARPGVEVDNIIEI